MARPRTRIPLNVFLNGRLVGRLRRQASGAIDFQYDDSWLAWNRPSRCRCRCLCARTGLLAIL